MKDLRSKKAIAASLSLTLALGSVPAVALADNADENGEGATSEQSSQAQFIFSANGGQFADGSNSASVMGNEGGSVDAPTPTRAGYTFKGWYSQLNMDGIPEDYQQYYKLDLSSAKAGSWFAAWEKNAEAQAQSVEVVSFFQGGERDGSSVTTTIDVTADSSVADCVKSFEGYTPTKVVSGAATSEEEVNMTSSLEGITALYVYYKADEQKTEQSQINVLYAANGGQFVDGNETMQGVADADGKLRQPPTPTREGYTFAGWYWHADLSQYTDEQKAADKVDFNQAVTGQGVTMFAQWTKNEVQNETDVLYVANGGKFADGQEVQQGLTDSDGMMRQPMTPTREGYTFAGWYWVSDLSDLTDELYESKIVYRTEKFEDNVRTFCMNPNGIVVNENTNGIVTVNGHSYEDKSLQTENTNFALLVAKHFSEPFKDSNGYGESIARLSNMLGGGVIVQRFGDLVRGRRSTVKRIEEGLVTPTLAATPGDLSLVLPKRILDGIIEMIYALDKIAPGTANDDTLLYGVEVKFYNMEVALDEHLETPYKGLYVIGDGSGITHSLSHASASGVYVAREILETV